MPYRLTPGPDATPRRGMLLLLVVSILALFVVIGAVGVLMALRARDTARAFAAAAVAPAGSAALARAQLDEALLRLIRGGNSSGTVTSSPTTECLLQDKYGSSSTCTVTGATAVTAALVQVTTNFDTSNPAAVAGRVLTFVPAPNDPTGPASYRIIRADKGTGTLWITGTNVRSLTPMNPPSVYPCQAVINGREYDNTAGNEPFDAFSTATGTTDFYLTNTGTLANSRVQQVTQPAFGTAGQTCTVDNDGDGVLDGIWRDDVLPPQRTPGGGQMSFSVSYLVLDLDCRINVNAHGSFVRAQALQSSAQYPRDPATVPVGMGYGPADVDAARLVSPVEVQSGTALPARYGIVLQGGSVTTSATASTATQWRPTPQVGATQAGRYGNSQGPGNAASTTGGNTSNADYWMLNPAGNSPTDLKARLQSFTEGSPPVLKFARPSPAWGASDTDDIVGAALTAHPYALRLDEDAPRAAGANAIDAPYTVAELERILRPFDAEAAQLSPRLAAILDDEAERLRMTVTTDSWDTPAITGTTAQTIAAAVTAGDPNAVLSPETVAGLRFNLNRPLTTGSARQEYFRHFYTLCVALGVPSGTAAQWAANVIEFRDPDSIMSWYPYDTNPLDGAWSTGTGVWGMERPEVAITRALSQAGSKGAGTSLNFSLYRPWKAELCTGNSTVATGTTELIDGMTPQFGNRMANTLRLTGSSGADAIWQLAVSNTGSLGTRTLASLIASATAVQTNTTLSGSVSPLSGTATLVTLQRLANPAAARDTNSASATYNDYVPVHRVTVPLSSRTPSRWLHWPNRDFVSHGELLAVLSGGSNLPEAMFSAASESSVARSFPAILDATIVPSRFAGANVSVANGSAQLAGTGYENFQYGQLSRWREAGRVNVNTIVSNTGCTPVSLDNAVWKALVGRSDVANPVTSGTAYDPFRSMSDLLMSGTFTRTVDANSAFLERSTAIRLANCATIRSHVFAVWITLRMTDDVGSTPRYARLFAIVDRSIPVGYQPGCTHNVRETIRLQRFLP